MVRLRERRKTKRITPILSSIRSQGRCYPQFKNTSKRRKEKKNLKNVFLQGASFVIQNIEDFDYTFTLEQQRNLMDRAYYLAKSNTDYIAIDELRKFIDTVMPDLDYRKFIVKR